MPGMKTCKHCKSEINTKAKRCPECQGDLRIWPSRHKIITGLGVFVILIIIIVAASSGSKSGSPNNTSAQQPPQVVDASSIVKEFDANKIAAQDKYNGKVIQTTGYITNISSALDNFYIQFKPTNDQLYVGTSFQCYVSKDDASAVQNGQQVTVKGTVNDETLTLIQLKKCSVVK